MNKQKLVFLILIILIVGSAFYWFEIRPSQIRKECAYKLPDFGLKSIWDSLSESKSKSKDEYVKCIRLRGLKE